MDRTAFYEMINTEREDGRAYERIRDPAELRGWLGCTVRARVALPGGKTAYRHGGTLKTVDEHLRFVYVVSLADGKDYSIRIPGSTFWALPRLTSFDELEAWKAFVVHRLP